MFQASARIFPSFFVRAAQLMRGRRDCPIRVPPHAPQRMPLTGISNHASRALPAPVQVSRMPSSAANADPSDALRAPGPNEEALEILSSQIHLLLSQTREHAPARFGRALDTLALDPKQPLVRRQCSLLLRAIKELPQGATITERQNKLRMALYDLTRAARAEAMLHEQIARHTEREKANALPGSQRSASTGGMFGVRFGLPGAVDAGAALGASRDTSIGTFDDLTIGTVRSGRVMAEATAQAKVVPGVGVSARLSGYSSEGDADISMSMRTRVLRLAHASVERRLGGNALQRAFNRVTEPRRDRYDERTSRALALQSTLPVLLGQQAVARPLAFGKRGLLISAGMTTHGGALDAAASYGVGQLGASGTLTRTELRAALPTRLTELGNDDRPASRNADIHAALDARLSQRVASALDARPAVTHGQLPALHAVRDLMRDPREAGGMARRLDAVGHVRAAFDHLQALADLSIRAPAHARAPLASLARDWGGTGTALEPVMIGMLDTLAWLQAAPEPDAGPAHVQWAQLQRSVQAEARRIHDTTMPHDREWMKRATHAFRQQTQRIASTSGTLSLSAVLPLFSASGAVTVERQVRQDPDPLRDGMYLQVTFAAELAPSLGTILSELERQLPAWGTLPLDQAQALIDPIGATMGLGGAMRYKLRFFRPSFQNDPDFPRGACGSHVYSARLEAGTSKGLDVTVPVPLAPGVAPTLTLQHSRANTTTLLERLPSTTLTNTLMRYQSECSATTPRADTWARMLALYGADLDTLAEALVDWRSVPALEARYWLQREPATSAGATTTRRDAPDTSSLDAFNLEADPATRRDQLFALFEAVGDITGRQKAMSALIGPLTLPVDA